MFKIGVMASGGGSNFKAIIDRIGEGDLEAQCKFLITNNGGCGAVSHAESYGIPVFHISGKTHPDTAAYEAALLEVIDRYDIDLLILAGYMKALPASLIKRLPDRILNIHPSLLPKYGGKGMWGPHVHEAVKAAGETETGMTIHWVTPVCDAGEIIAQYKVALSPEDTVDDIAEKEHQLEMEYFPKEVEKIIKAL